jgi:hypothetical protein
VTTDSSGQARFAVPYAAPSGLPIVTATATDPLGNTSEVSSPLQGGFEPQSGVVRLAPGQQSVLFSPASGDVVRLAGSTAGENDGAWGLTLFVSAGSVTLAGTDGLIGSGDGTGSLSYIGTLSSFDAGLNGMTYVPPVGLRGNATLTVQAIVDGIAMIAGQVTISTGSFLVTSTGDGGPGSLRQAILDSNAATGGTNTIDFAIPGSGVHTIVPLSPLPAITQEVLIDGSSQPSYVGTPLIDLSSQDLDGAFALSVGSNVTLRGVVADVFAFGARTPLDVLTLQSVPLPAGQGGTGGATSYQIDTAIGEELMALVHPSAGLTTRLLLLDVQGHVLTQSDSQSAGNGDDVINTYVAAGSYAVEVQGLGRPGSFTLTAALSPATNPLRPLPAGMPIPGTWSPSGEGAVAGDFGGEGHLDFALTSPQANSIEVLLGNGDGTFQPAVTYAVGPVPLAIVAGAFTGNGRLDLAVANDDGVSVLLSRPAEELQRLRILV